jgi:hypothetical protein
MTNKNQCLHDMISRLERGASGMEDQAAIAGEMRTLIAKIALMEERDASMFENCVKLHATIDLLETKVSNLTLQATMSSNLHALALKQRDDAWAQVSEMREALTRSEVRAATPQGEGTAPGCEKLCEDEGCPHHGQDHVCIDSTRQRRAAKRLGMKS